MRTHRLAIAGFALVASTVLMSCGSDDPDNAPVNSDAPVVADSTIATLPIADTTINAPNPSGDLSTETTLP